MSCCGLKECMCYFSEAAFMCPYRNWCHRDKTCSCFFRNDSVAHLPFCYRVKRWGRWWWLLHTWEGSQREKTYFWMFLEWTVNTIYVSWRVSFHCCGYILNLIFKNWKWVFCTLYRGYTFSNSSSRLLLLLIHILSSSLIRKQTGTLKWKKKVRR